MKNIFISISLLGMGFFTISLATDFDNVQLAKEAIEQLYNGNLIIPIKPDNKSPSQIPTSVQPSVIVISNDWDPLRIIWVKNPED